MTTPSRQQDTWGNLPAVTLPMQTVWEDSAETIFSVFSGQFAAPRPELGADLGASAAAEAAEAERWANWGAARAGARISVSFDQLLALAVLCWVAALVLYLDPFALLVAPVAAISCVYLAIGAHKLWLLARAERATGSRRGETLPVSDDALPLYTVLVPLHQEGQMLPALLQRLAALDYPSDRLEVFLLIEFDDVETHAAIAACHLPPHIRPITLPPGQPRTKPRALNVGLARASGSHIVIYDAEDRPEPDQLRKAVAAFLALPRRVICLQARLNFYNRHQTLLTRLFTVDYVLWYNGLLPGLTQPASFVPLGGTSNHFRTEALRRLGGWDPFNVTEDCDLGVRIARAGLRVAMLDSTTWEEAVTRVWPWIRQRSRWVKGFLQTYLVHMRHPSRLLRDLGPGGFLDFQALVGGATFTLLINPVMWLLTLAYVFGQGTPTGALVRVLFPSSIYYLALVSMVLGNFIFFYINIYTCVRHRVEDLARYALLCPFYWVLMSVGAWLGLFSLLFHPHYWAKTPHGASLVAREPAAGRTSLAFEPGTLDTGPAPIRAET